MERVLCEDCVFWEIDDSWDFGGEQGYCHRHAPSGNSCLTDVAFYWPITFCKDWCGEAQRKEV